MDERLVLVSGDVRLEPLPESVEVLDPAVERVVGVDPLLLVGPAVDLPLGVPGRPKSSSPTAS